MVTSVIGIAGYSANFIQFGLDQLLEAPSRYQGIFVHWAKWCFDLVFNLSIVIIDAINYKSSGSQGTVPEIVTFIFCTFCLFLMLFLLSVIGCWKHHWFYSEPRHRNPYRMVV